MADKFSKCKAIGVSSEQGHGSSARKTGEGGLHSASHSSSGLTAKWEIGWEMWDKKVLQHTMATHPPQGWMSGGSEQVFTKSDGVSCPCQGTPLRALARLPTTTRTRLASLHRDANIVVRNLIRSRESDTMVSMPSFSPQSYWPGGGHHSVRN